MKENYPNILLDKSIPSFSFGTLSVSLKFPSVERTQCRMSDELRHLIDAFTSWEDAELPKPSYLFTLCDWME